MFENAIQSLRGRKPHILGHENCFESAVALPLVEKDGQVCVLFEKRSDNVLQPGEVSFPGGRIEPDDSSPQEAAVRETCEELGLRPERIEVIAPLDIMVSPFNAIVYPFLIKILNPELINPNWEEVAEIFYVPLDYLLNYDPLYKSLLVTVDYTEDFPFELIPHGKNYPFRKGTLPQFFYIWEHWVIWGLTARILNHFLALLRTCLGKD
ncbi:MAG TPA: CoA pyrophosphatase [Syntrophomonadaceae bacterium]|nr:CoA pyrophosphatase [Syntrophomonadaceae bacterium]HOQ09243.1 CoA pyrophosphatase [Syntrophomonadaceae bacterium]HPU49057.1 CoA pyrophosphatase [Syntrophomonadaceae bacterium]